jgi:hypothetical protein
MPTTILLEPPTECPESELEFARSFIAACGFKAATQGGLGGRPMAESQHQYCPRRSLPESRQRDFDRFATLIDQHGFRGRFLNSVYTYLLVPGDDGHWRYWRSPSWFPTIEATGMLNRADSASSPMLPPGSVEPPPPPSPQLQMEV